MFLRQLTFLMDMTVFFMVVDAQNLIAVRINAFPAFGRSFQRFCHLHPSQYKPQIKKPQRLVVFLCGLKIPNLMFLNTYYYVSIIPRYSAVSSNLSPAAGPKHPFLTQKSTIKNFFLFLSTFGVEYGIIANHEVYSFISQECASHKIRSRDT